MPELTYKRQGLVLEKASANRAKQLIRDLQRDLRQLGYLKNGIDGSFGAATEIAVKALRYDLLHNVGESTGDDGDAPVRVIDYNRGRVVEVTGTVDQGLAECIADMLDDPYFPRLPKSDDPKLDNERVLSRAGLQRMRRAINFEIHLFQSKSDQNTPSLNIPT